MAEEIFGPFDSVEEAVKTVDILELEGYSNSNITIFADGTYAEKLHDKTDVRVVSLEHETNQDDPSIIDKIKK